MHASRVLTVFCVVAAAVCMRGAWANPKDVAAPPAIEKSLAGPWRFQRGTVADGHQQECDDTKWSSVTLPHTWNNKDGQDGGSNYHRGTGWYRMDVTLDQTLEGRVPYVFFEGANRATELFVNGSSVGTHTGGFAAFAFRAEGLKPGKNLLAVKVDNAHNPDSPPLSGDFTFCGGIYRPARLLLVDPISFDLQDHAAPVRISVSEVKADLATVQITADVRNHTAQAADTSIVVTISDNAGRVVAREQSPLRANANAASAVTTVLTIKSPHLWQGKKDPYLYTARVTLSVNGRTTDVQDSRFGVRTVAVDAKKGFLLNGQPYKLYGVNRHQDWLDKGWAITPTEMDTDIALLKELGVTAVRLAHYQHHQYFYDLCDKAGIVVWAELANVNNINNSDAYRENAMQQLTELIRQNQHHASIAFWSVGNEVTLKSGPNPWPLMKALSEQAKKEDPTRLTTHAIVGNGPKEPVADTAAFNRYAGWYGTGKPSDIVSWLDKQGSFAMSEYGAGAGITIHNEKPRRMDHSEEYQCLFHETYWRAMKDRPNIWGTFVWVFADFAADHRKEGEANGRNDKGLVTYDRQTKKDAFYFFKANWSQEPFVHITSRRFAVRGLQQIPVKVYGNASAVELLVNGVTMGRKSGDDGVFLWDKVALREGENTVEARATIDGKQVTDKVAWVYKPGAPTEINTPKQPAETTGLGH